VLTINPATRFVLAGGHRHCDGETMARHWMPAELSAQRGQFEFTGWLSAEELARWYATADILVVPSWYEPFGMVVLEGMLYGLPIIATDIGGPAEILEPGRTGLLVPPRDPEQLARAIIGLIGAPQTRRRLGLVAARVVRQTWSYTRVVDEMRSVYDEAIAEAKLRQEPFPSGKNGLTQDRPRAN
jgi:glycogen(starch) synthase